MTAPIVMTIAGSDPSGSSGLQADLPTIAMLGAHATSVTTVVTAQSSHGISAYHELPIELVEAQLAELVDDMAPDATKTGLLRTTAVIEVVASHAAAGRLGSLVVDPVMVDSSGSAMVTDQAVAAYRQLASSAAVLTPNRWEAELLTGLPFGPENYRAPAEALLALGPDLVVVTGGRGGGHEVCDVIITGDGIVEASESRTGAEPIRGTGCTFSAAAATFLAQGEQPLEAVEQARQVVRRQLQQSDALKLGGGRPGVPHGMHWKPK